MLLADTGFLDPVVKGTDGAIVFVGEKVQIGGGVAPGYRQADGEVAEKMNAALAEIEADGTLSKLLIEYFENDPWSE